jgi:hypothetical protein
MQPGNVLRQNDIRVEVNLLLQEELTEVAEVFVRTKLGYT